MPPEFSAGISANMIPRCVYMDPSGGHIPQHEYIENSTLLSLFLLFILCSWLEGCMCSEGKEWLYYITM